MEAKGQKTQELVNLLSRSLPYFQSHQQIEVSLKQAISRVSKGDMTGAMVARQIFGRLNAYMEFRNMDSNFLTLKHEIYAITANC